jgi:hypothetical protein
VNTPIREKIPSFVRSNSYLVSYSLSLGMTSPDSPNSQDGVHHYDEYGLRNIGEEPEEIRKIHGQMIVFVMEWMKQWKVDAKRSE